MGFRANFDPVAVLVNSGTFWTRELWGIYDFERELSGQSQLKDLVLRRQERVTAPRENRRHYPAALR